jgi:hypothetical protein
MQDGAGVLEDRLVAETVPKAEMTAIVEAPLRPEHLGDVPPCGRGLHIAKDEPSADRIRIRLRRQQSGLVHPPGPCGPRTLGLPPPK